MDVSVIVVNYNTIKYLCEAIDSVISNTVSLNFEIIIVDNASQDNSAHIIAERFGSRVQFLSIPENIGFGRANNEGIKIAKGRNILFLNPDTVLINNAIKELSQYLDMHPDTAIVGGNLFNMEMVPTHSFRRFFPSLFWEFNDLLFSIAEKVVFGKNAQFNHKEKVLDVAYITGADLMISRKILGKIGCFDPGFFMYFEETDLAFRVHQCGYKVKSIPWAKIQHLEGGSFNLKADRADAYYRGKLLFYRKHYSFVTFNIVRIIIRLTFYSRILAFSIFFNRPKMSEWKSAMDSFYSNSIEKGSRI